MITTASLPGNGREVCSRFSPDAGCHIEFVTSGYIGAMKGDPRGGHTRVVTANQAPGNPSTTVYYIGLQANGSKFLDQAGTNEFAGPGEIGMLDWGAWRPAGGNESAKGVAALTPTNDNYGGGLSMARTLGSDANQVAVHGRRVIVAWLSAMLKLNDTSYFKLNCQSLPQDLTLGVGEVGEVILKQAFSSELAMLRSGKVDFPSVSGTVCLPNKSCNFAEVGQQFEIYATMKPADASGVASLDVLLSPHVGSSWSTIAVDFKKELIFVNASLQHNPVVRAGPLYPGAAHGVAEASVHIIVDHSIICVIVNNRTSLTVAAVPPSVDAGGVRLGAGVQATAWPLKTANENMAAQNASEPQMPAAGMPWTQPKVHNSPQCV